ncbi:hypothetical protein H5410_022235 [Solanum commersonii]|uniref:Uncharacterized protein n=1 Tax=Solanum commersonii TaxID=4109 RepID=A0A9J5ZE83_SOLCO|nr:hypothetical protein H5410_022235 [Solanum commersonii]
MEVIQYQIGVQTTRQEIIRSNTLCLTGVDSILDEFIEETEIILNPQHDLVAEDQVYPNKHIISEVMKRYAFLREFCFIATSCGRFQHDEISCSHEVVATRYRNKHRKDYCSVYYSNKNFQNTYAIPIEPLPCESTWDIPSHILKEIMIPPIASKLLGRPPNNDRKK